MCSDQYPVLIITITAMKCNTRQFIPKHKWFSANKETFQKYQYELDQQLGSIPLNEWRYVRPHP